ncbi:hypothetical protein WJX72_001042 [[Myrmecia] bisecta]|uniref:Exocyst complex component n=1 Tax=[Myrmecia] bisecta TaxID=41462 RepID=A0AAW1QE39_9CHLO
MGDDRVSDSVRDLVTGGLDAEDISPLVRLVFDGHTNPVVLTGTPQLQTAESTVDSSLPEDENGDENGPGERSSKAKGLQEDPSEAVMVALQSVADEQAVEILQICRSNADEIARSIQELGSMQTYATALREKIVENNDSLQEAGGSFLAKMQELRELRQVQQAITESRKAVSAGIRLLQMCAAAGHYTAENKLYRAFKLLERIRTEFFQQQEPQKENIRSNRKVEVKEPGSGKKGKSGGSTVASLGRLQPFLAARVDELTHAIEQRAIADFNNWLVSVRAEARNIGMRAVRRAAAERQREEVLGKERKILAMQLHDLTDPKAVAAMMATARGAEGATGNAAASAAPAVKLDPHVHPSAHKILASSPKDANEDLLAGVDMALMHRCVQVHKCLGRMAAFQAYYHKNRRLQLNSDLTLPLQFLETYQNFVSQIVGYFIVEDRVQRSAADMAVGVQVDAGWETAVACLKGVLEASFDNITIAPAMLALKDFMMLVCSALGQCGYHVVPITEILMNGRNKYHELLGTGVAPQVSAAVTNDRLDAVVVRSEAVARQLNEELGLPLSFQTQAEPRRLPYDLPFSEMVPALLRVVRGYIEDSISYLAGLVSPGEVLPVARQYRDRMLTKIMIETLEASVAAFSLTVPQAMRRSMQLVANAACLIEALGPLDDYTVLKGRGTSPLEKHGQRGGAHHKAHAGPGHHTAASARDITPSDSPPRNSRGARSRKPEKPEKPAAVSAAPSRGDLSGNSGLPPGSTTGSTGALAAFQAFQETCERVVVRVAAGMAGAILRTTNQLNWLPDQPPRTGTGHTPYIQDMLQFLQEALAMGKAMLPAEPYEHVARATFNYIGDAIMNLLAEDLVPAYNMFAMFRLHADLADMAAFADACDLPLLADGLAEPVQFCELMVTGRLEEILDAAKRQASYAAVDLARLVLVLEKYREVGDKASYTGHHMIGRSKQPESFLKKKTADKVGKQLRELLRDVEGY